MQRVLFVAAVMVVAVCALVFSSQAESVSLRGEYVEVRTASVFAGACHYNGEVVTTGRDAVMAWNVTSGKWQGVDLARVRALAIITAEANLSDDKAARQSQIFIDSQASGAQSQAMIDALKVKYAAALGNVVTVRTTPISFERNGRSYAVAADGAFIDIEAMPNDLCCKMPNLVWYSPLVRLENRKVGYTVRAGHSGKTIGTPWSRSGENSAFYGSFSL